MASRPYVDIPFGPYLPDFGGMPNPDIPGYLVDAEAMRSTPNGWRGMPTFANVVGATAIGGTDINYCLPACFYSATLTHFFVVTDAGTIYESRNEGKDTWENVSTTGTLDPFGDYFRFGDDIVYACAGRAPIKKSLGSSHATDFSDLGGSPPTGATGARIGQHAVLGGGGLFYSIRTSSIGNHEDWPTPGSSEALARQSIQEDLNPEYGPVRRILGGEKIGIVVQDSALTRMTYVGGSVVYNFDTYERIDGQGTRLWARPVTDGQLWYFYTDSGVYITDGYQVRSASDGKIDESLFLNSIGHPNGASLEAAFTSAYDRYRGHIIFGASDNDGTGRRQLVYNVPNGSFSLANEINEMAMFSGYEQVGSGLAGIVRRPWVYNINGSDRKLQKLSGAASNIALQTGFIEIDPGYRFQFQGAHLLGVGTGSLTLAYKTAATSAACDTLQTGFTSATAATLGEKKTARASAQYIAFRISGTGAEAQLIRGVRVYFERAEPAP